MENGASISSLIHVSEWTHRLAITDETNGENTGERSGQLDFQDLSNEADATRTAAIRRCAKRRLSLQDSPSVARNLHRDPAQEMVA